MKITFINNRTGVGGYELSNAIRDLLDLNNAVFGPSDFKTTQAGSLGRNVTIAAGSGYIYIPSLDGYYRVFETAPTTLPLDPNPAGSTRYDLVCIKVDTSVQAAADGSGVAAYIIVKGTAGSGIPATPANHHLLYVVELTASYTDIYNKNLFDARSPMTLSDSVVSPLPHSIYRRAIINGNFDIWQRTTSKANPADAEYVADRFRVKNIPASGTLPTTITHSQQSFTVAELDKSQYFYRIAPNGAGSGFGATAEYGISQRILNGTRLLCGANKKVSLRFKARASVSGKKIGVYLVQHYGTGGSPSASEVITGKYYNLTSSLQDITLTVDTNTLSGKTFGTNGDDYLEVVILTMWGSGAAADKVSSTAVGETFGASGTIDIAQLRLNAGGFIMPFYPKKFSEEIYDCMDFYEKSFAYEQVPTRNLGANNDELYFFGSSQASGLVPFTILFKKRKFKVPTMKYYTRVGAVDDQWDFERSASSGNAAPSNIATGREKVTIGVNVGANWVAVGIMGHYTAEAEL